MKRSPNYFEDRTKLFVGKRIPIRVVSNQEMGFIIFCIGIDIAREHPFPGREVT